MRQSRRTTTITGALGALLLATATLGAGCAGEVVIEDEPVSSTQAMTFEEFLEVVYQEPDSGVYIVNGDTPIDSYDELVEFYETYIQNGALIVHTSGGVDAIWSESEASNLTYCISQSSFGANYDRVVTAMAEAAGAWEAAANVDFVHDASKDGGCNARTKGVVFDVRQVGSGQYLARAFFPDDRRRNRNVLIDTSTYAYDDDASDPLSLAGVLRHELGHALGFRHEHTRPESGTCFEDNNWRELTDYDSESVMHYPQCNGDGDWSLTLTALDQQGAAELYGAPGSGSGGSGSGGSGSGGSGAGGSGAGGSGSGGSGAGPVCGDPGDSCDGPGDCCSLTCKGKPGSRTCK